MSYLEHKAAECSRCHTREDEWKADPDAYYVDDYVCEGCGRLDDEEQNVPTGKDEARYYLRGKHTYLKPAYVMELEQELAEEEAAAKRREPLPQ